MKKLSALVVDDEVGAREAMVRLLNLYCPEFDTVVAVADARTAIEKAQKQSFDVAFLDIELRRSSGLELAEQMIQYCPKLIFVTAYDKYAVAAFQTPVTNYLLKPVSPKQLKNAVAQLKVSDQTASGERILLPTNNGVIVLKQDDIIWVESAGNYCRFHCEGGKQYYLSRNLGHFEALLNNHRFFRIHQSHLIKLTAVRELKQENGMQVILKTGVSLPLAVRRKEEFMERLAAGV